MSESVPAFSGLSLSKIGDLGIQVLQEDEAPPAPVAPGEHDIERSPGKRSGNS